MSTGDVRAALHARVTDLIRALADGARDDDTRDALLLDLARYQRDHISAYARLWTPGCSADATDADFTDVHAAIEHTRAPAVPTDVFRYARMAAHPPEQDVALFRTSGTTSGARGEHPFRDLSLYHLAAEAAARRMLFPDVARTERMRLLSVTPSDTDAPESSLSHMLSRFFEWIGDAPSRFCTTNGLPDTALLRQALARAVDEGQPVALLGTSFALVHVLDAFADDRDTFTLPPGSRIMQTGGFKGRTREVAPAAMREALSATFAVPDPFVIAEYGMTELSSQFYETTLRDALLGRPIGPRRLCAPTWVRATPVDPETLHVVPGSRSGLLRIDDPANLDSVAAVQTSDLAEVVHERVGAGRTDRGAGIRLLGRARGSVARGCSLALEEALGR